MASTVVSSLGNELPTARYAAGVVDAFPRVNRLRLVESSIASRETEFILPVNITSGGNITDRYLEYRIHGIEGSFLDLSSIAIELHGGVKLNDGNPLPEDKDVSFANFLSNTLFKACQVYVGERLIEANPHYNYWSYIKNLTSARSTTLHTLGKTGYNVSKEVVCDVIADDYFTKLKPGEKERIKNDKKGLHIIHPLLLDSSSTDEYLVDNISVRVKLEIASDAWFINSPGDNSNIRFYLNEARLHIDRIVPRPPALLALHKALASPNNSVQSVFDKTLYRIYTLASNQTRVTLDRPFNSVIPEKLYIAMTSMESFNGKYNRNPLYFGHYYLSNVHVTLNGSTLYDINSDFPNNNFVHMYYETMKSLSLPYDHLLGYNNFANGQSLMVFNFKSETTDDTMEVEKTGNLRINLTFNVAVDENRVIMLFGETQGVISINHDRIVHCNVRG